MATGRIVSNPAGGYSIIIEMDRDPKTGKRKRKKVRAKENGKILNQKETKKLMTKLLYEIEQGTYIEPSQLTLEDFFQQWIDNYCNSNLESTTAENYGIIISKHIVPGLGNIPIGKLRPLHIQNYYTEKLQNGRVDGKGGLSNRSVRYHHSILNKALDTAVKWKIISHNPCKDVNPPKKIIKEKKIFTPEQLKTFFKYIKDKPLFELFFLDPYTGLRRGELLGLQWQYVNFNKEEIQVVNTIQIVNKQIIFKKPKNKKSIRTIPLSHECFFMLKRLQQKQKRHKLKYAKAYQDYDLLFCNEDGTPLNPKSVSKRFGEYAKDAGLKDLTLHSMRHTFATYLLGSGKDLKTVQELLGHKLASTTLDTYGHAIPGNKKEAINDLSNIFSGTKNGTE